MGFYIVWVYTIFFIHVYLLRTLRITFTAVVMKLSEMMGNSSWIMPVNLPDGSTCSGAQGCCGGYHLYLLISAHICGDDKQSKQDPRHVMLYVDMSTTTSCKA